MTLRAKRILGLFTVALVITIYLTRCQENSFYIRHIDRRQVLNVKQTKQTNFRMTIDGSPINVEITGELDGKAVVFMPIGPQDSTGLPLWRNGIGIYNDRNMIILVKGKINKKVNIGEAVGNFQLIYQPITAKDGALSIKVDY